MAYNDWSANPALNALQPGINWAEGMQPKDINGSARQMMADLAVYNHATGNALSLGVKGDGVTDDTAAIQAIMDNAAISRVWFPKGTYKVTATINVRFSKVIYGDGRENTNFVGGNFDVFNLDNGVGVMTGMRMFGFKISNPLARGAVVDGAGIRLYRCYYGMFDDILIDNCYYGVRSRQSNVTRYNGVDVTNFNYVGYKFSETLGFDSYVANCSISGGGAGFASVMLQDQCDEMTFYSVIMNTSVYNLYCDATAYGVNLCPEFCHFFGCSFDSCTTGVYLNHTTNMNFVGCFFSNRPGHGLTFGTVQPVETTSFTNCYFYANGGNGGLVGPYATDTLFSGCKFIGNSVTTPGAAHGLVVLASATDFQIVNCAFRNGWGSSGSQAYGVYVAVGSSDRFTIVGNNFGSNATGPLFMGATGAADRTISGNIGLRTKASGVASLLAGQNSVVVTHTLFAQPNAQDVHGRLFPNAVGMDVTALSATTITFSTNDLSTTGAARPLYWDASNFAN